MRVLLAMSLALSIVSCVDGSDDSAVTNFEVVWSDFDAHYGGFRTRGVDWDATYDDFRPRLHEASTDDELWEVLTEMFATLDDGHVWLLGPDRDQFRANADLRAPRLAFHPEDVAAGYLTSTLSYEPDAHLIGLLGDGAIYAHFRWVQPDMRRLERALDDHPEATGLVIDLRHNGGGDFTHALSLVGRLTRERRLAFRSRTRNGPERDAFGAYHDWWVEPTGAPFDGPVVVLVDRQTLSAGERVALMLRALPRARLVGEPTNGSLATMISRQAPNGWYYTMPVQEVFDADGRSWEGVGVPVDLAVTRGADEPTSTVDTVLEAAMDLLDAQR